VAVEAFEDFMWSKWIVWFNVANIKVSAYGRGPGVGRALGVGSDLGVGVGLGVTLGVPVGVGVGVTIGVGVGVGVGVEVSYSSALARGPLPPSPPAASTIPLGSKVAV